MENEEKFSRYKDESELSYIIRMCANKDLFGLSWKELAEEINKTLCLDFNESTYRKKYQYYKMCSDDKKEVEAKQSDILQELENKRIELKKEVYKLQTLRIDDNKKIREQSRNDLYFQEVVRAIENKENDNKVNLKDLKPLKEVQPQEQYVLCFSDVHFGKIFKSINNEYNIDICFNRMKELLEEVISCVGKYNIRHLNVCALGDLVEGMTLRMSQLQSLQIGLVDQTIQFANYMIDWLNELSRFVEIDYYSVMSSNHSQLRPYSSKPNEFVSEDMERVILAMLSKAFENNQRVHINTADQKYTKFQIFDYDIILLHGHETKDYTNLLKNLSWQHKWFFDYAITGHLHKGGVISEGEGLDNNCEVIRCPSIMGSDEYSDSLFVGAKPGAILIKFTREQGKRSVEDIVLH